MSHAGCATVRAAGCNNADISYIGVRGCALTQCYGSRKVSVCKTDNYTRSGTTQQLCNNRAEWEGGSCPDCSKGENRLLCVGYETAHLNFRLQNLKWFIAQKFKSKLKDFLRLKTFRFKWLEKNAACVILGKYDLHN